jgi:hypothetical protein
MQNPEDYRKLVLKVIFDDIQASDDILAAWEGGSAATGTKDQYSDIDLCLLTNAGLMQVLDRVEASLEKLGITHRWQTQKCFWGEGMMQRVLFLKDAPKHFLVDIAVFDQTNPQLLKDFLEIERHGNPILHFDKGHYIQLGHTDSKALFKRQQTRADELKQGFLVFKTLVLKEYDRKQPIDALSFYQNGIVRPLIEVLGMIHRPFKFDFGMRYLHKHFPLELQELIKELSYVAHADELPKKVLKAEKAFYEAIETVKAKTSLE